MTKPNKCIVYELNRGYEQLIHRLEIRDRGLNRPPNVQQSNRLGPSLGTTLQPSDCSRRVRIKVNYIEVSAVAGTE